MGYEVIYKPTLVNSEGKVKGTIKKDDETEAKKIKKGDKRGTLKLKTL